MDHTFAAIAAAATLHVLLLLACQCGAARPLRGESVEMSALAMAPASSAEGEAWGDGKWLPLTGGVHFPAFPAGASMPWVAGAPPAVAGTGVPLVPPYVGATRQEQIGLWASLFNPSQRPRLPGVGDGEAVRVEPKASTSVVGEAARPDVEIPAAGAVQIGEPKWGVYMGNNGN